jgi:hypothetical protein
LSKGKNKNKVLNLYATEINNQRALLKKTKSKSARKQPIEHSDDSTSEEEETKDMHTVDCPIEPEVIFKTPKRKRRKVTSKDESSASVEEGAFKKKIANLGQTIDTKDESTVQAL